MSRAAMMFSVILMSSVMTVACQQQSEPAATQQPAAASAQPASLTPEQLGELGAEISSDPARADELLAAKRMTRASFEQAIRALTENPEASKRYAEAYRKRRA